MTPPQSRMIVSPEKVMQLPLHDALIFGLNVAVGDKGFLEASLEVKINPADSLEPFKELGIQSSTLRLIFSDCWQVATNLMGYCSGPEVMSTYDIIESSELKQKLRAFNVGSSTMIHFRICGSAGSQMDFVAETFSVVEGDHTSRGVLRR